MMSKMKFVNSLTSVIETSMVNLMVIEVVKCFTIAACQLDKDLQINIRTNLTIRIFATFSTMEFDQVILLPLR